MYHSALTVYTPEEWNKDIVHCRPKSRNIRESDIWPWVTQRSAYGHVDMMTSSNGNIFRVTGPLCGEFTGHRWIPRTKASDAELWRFVSFEPEPNGWVNNRKAGDLRRHRDHYYVAVMKSTDFHYSDETKWLPHICVPLCSSIPNTAYRIRCVTDDTVKSTWLKENMGI